MDKQDMAQKMENREKLRSVAHKAHYQARKAVEAYVDASLESIRAEAQALTDTLFGIFEEGLKDGVELEQMRQIANSSIEAKMVETFNDGKSIKSIL